MNTLEKLRYLIDVKGVSRYELAKLFEMSKTTLTNYYEGKTTPSNLRVDVMERSINGCYSGLLSESEGNSSENDKSKSANTIQAKPEYHEETRPRVPYDAAAGALSIALSGITEDECEQVPVIKAFSSYNYSLFVTGDSMEPELHSGDELFCKSVATSGFIRWGDIHVLDTSQGIVVKRIYDDGEYIVCKSELSEVFKDLRIPKHEIYNVGLVVGMIRRY